MNPDSVMHRDTSTEHLKPKPEQHVNAKIQARWIPVLAPFLPQNDERDFTLGGVQIEPREEGGVTLFATDGYIAVLIADPEGYASAPLILEIPAELLAACAPRKAPPLYDANCERIQFDLEPWFQPGRIDIFADLEEGSLGFTAKALVLVNPLEELPPHLRRETSCEDGAGLYVGHPGVRKRELINWRPTFERPQVPADLLTINAQLLARACAVLGPFCKVTFGALGSPLILEVSERAMAYHFKSWKASIRAAVMPLSSLPVPSAAAPESARKE